MVPRSSLAFATVLAACAAAQTTTLSAFLVQILPEEYDVAASVVGVKDSTTTLQLRIACAVSTPGCQMAEDVTYITGPSTAIYSDVQTTIVQTDDPPSKTIVSGLIDQSMGCTITEATATCTGAISYSYSLDPVVTDVNPTEGQVEEVTVITNTATRVRPITVTAGADLLAAAAGAAPTGTDNHGGSSGSGFEPPSSAPPSTGGMPRVTQPAVLAGAAVALGVGGAFFA